MNPKDGVGPHPTRRGLVRVAAGIAAAGSGLGIADVAGAAIEARDGGATSFDDKSVVEPFWDEHRGGIMTPPQRHSYFVAFDLRTAKRDDVIKMLRVWTAAAAQMATGDTAVPIGSDPAAPGPDTGEAIGLSAERLTLTFGFGAGLFIKDGKDRYGLAAQRPSALVDLPRFNGDQLIETRTGGDLSVRACADDPQVAFHAARQLALAYAHIFVFNTRTITYSRHART